MSTITDTARLFFDTCETGKGWAGCSAYCAPNATFAAQAEPLADVKTLQQYLCRTVRARAHTHTRHGPAMAPPPPPPPPPPHGGGKLSTYATFGCGDPAPPFGNRLWFECDS